MSTDNSKKKGIFNAQYLANTTLISTNTSIVGQVNSLGNIRVDGTVTGDIEADGRVIIGQDGKVHGNIHAENLDIYGQVKGNLTIKDKLSIQEKSSLTGDIKAKHLVVEETAFFKGMCDMEVDSPVKS